MEPLLVPGRGRNSAKLRPVPQPTCRSRDSTGRTFILIGRTGPAVFHHPRFAPVCVKMDIPRKAPDPPCCIGTHPPIACGSGTRARSDRQPGRRHEAPVRGDVLDGAGSFVLPAIPSSRGRPPSAPGHTKRRERAAPQCQNPRKCRRILPRSRCRPPAPATAQYVPAQRFASRWPCRRPERGFGDCAGRIGATRIRSSIFRSPDGGGPPGLIPAGLPGTDPSMRVRRTAPAPCSR